MASCPLCRQRKGKRACPAKGAEICSHCCGTKRQIEIDCPTDCVYLGGAHSGAWEGREAERRRDTLRLAPHLQGLSDEQSRLLLLTLVGIHGLRGRRRDLDDRLLREAVGALHKTVGTRVRGLLYEHPPDDLRAQGLLEEIKDLYQATDEEGRKATPDDKDLLPVLAALEAALAATLEERAAPTAFLDTVARLVSRFGPVRPKSSLIVAS